jgi:hypothetical protein
MVQSVSIVFPSESTIPTLWHWRRPSRHLQSFIWLWLCGWWDFNLDTLKWSNPRWIVDYFVAYILQCNWWLVTTVLQVASCWTVFWRRGVTLRGMPAVSYNSFWRQSNTSTSWASCTGTWRYNCPLAVRKTLNLTINSIIGLLVYVPQVYQNKRE